MHPFQLIIGHSLWATYYSNNNLKDRIIHGLRIDEPIRLDQFPSGQSYFYLVDGLGSAVNLVDAAGVIRQSYSYDSFGNILQQMGTVNQAFTYTGREWEGASPNGTGLYYYRARYYDPTMGRFLSEDPLGFLGGVNFYPYVGNNPVNYVDPLGLIWSPYGIAGGQLSGHAALVGGNVSAGVAFTSRQICLFATVCLRVGFGFYAGAGGTAGGGAVRGNASNLSGFSVGLGGDIGAGTSYGGGASVGISGGGK